MVRRKMKWTALKRIEVSTLCVFGGWLLLTLALWWTPWLEKNRAIAGFSLFFYVLIYVLLGVMRQFQQFRYVPPSVEPELAERLVRLRVRWTAELRLLFAGGFAGTALTLPFNNALRRSLVWLFLMALAASAISFWLRWRKAEKSARVPK